MKHDMNRDMNRHAVEHFGLAQTAAFASTCLIWGSTFLVIRVGNEALPPLWAATFRLALAAILNAAIALIVRAPWPRDSGGLAGPIQYGLTMYGGNFALLYWGEQTVPSGIAAVLYATSPLSTAAFAAMLHVHPLERSKLVAALIGVIGVCLIFSGEIRLGAPVVPLLGVFTAATIASLGNVLLKRAPVQSTFVVNAIGCTVGMSFCGVASVLSGETWTIPHNWAQWGPLLYLVLLGNLGAYALFTWMVTQWTVTRLMVGSLIIPVIAVILGAIVRAEAPAPGTYLGAAVVLLAVAVSMRAPRKREEMAGQEK